jgi:predicted nucleic acid-binding protein
LRIYCDSSALLKRPFDEPESTSLEIYLADRVSREDELVTSALARVEINRAIRARREASDPGEWFRYERHALSGVQELVLDVPTMSLARTVGPPSLRSLDAIHLAAAIQADVDLMLTYDQRLVEVALEMGIESSSPGSV